MVERERQPAPSIAPPAPALAVPELSLAPATILALQQTAGNAAVSDMLAGEPVLESSHPDVNGKPVSVVAADLRKRDERSLEVTPLIRSHAVNMRRQEHEWDDKRGVIGGFIDLFNDEDQPNPGRWLQVMIEWDIVAAELNAALLVAATPETINDFGRRSELALDHWRRTAQLSSKYTNQFEAYLRGFSGAAEGVLTATEIVKDVGFAIAVGAAVVAFSPAVFAAYSAYAGAAGLGATGTAIFAGGGTALTMGGVGSVIEGGGEAVGSILGQGFWVLEEVIVEGQQWSKAVDDFDWGAVGRNGWNGVKRGFIDGVLAYAGVRMEAALAKPAGAAVNKMLGAPSGRALALVLRRALQRAISGGATGSVIGALDAGLKKALAGGNRDEIVHAMEIGFAIGAAGGTVLGAAGGAMQGRAEARTLGGQLDDAFARLEAGEIPQTEHMEQYRGKFLETAGDTPTVDVLQRGRYEDVGGDLITEGLSQSTILRDRQTGELWFFKPQEGQVTINWTQDAGIASESFPRRAVAGEIAAKQAGIETPEIYLVEWEGQVGSVQRWDGNLRTLASLDQPAHQALLRSPEYLRLRTAADNFHFLIQNIDRNEGNFLVDLAPDGKLRRLIPIDHDRVFPPVPERQILPRYRAPLPQRYSRAVAANFRAMHSNKDHLRLALRGLLTEVEVEQALRRLDEAIADIDTKLATVGEAGTFAD
jgi:hypothetical protein